MEITSERSIVIAVFVTISVVLVSLFYLKRWNKLRKRVVEVQLEEDGDEDEEFEVVLSSCFSKELEEKPQYAFKRVIADNNYSAFNCLKREGKQNEISMKFHPYKDEITSLMDNPPVFLDFIKPCKCPKMVASYVWVKTQRQLKSLAELLSNEKVFSVDTEQHNIRSFLGFTALMQISTHKVDFLLDTIALHDVMCDLQPIFANPSICKVFHGSDNDILWLQRDFHIYIVNLFDTAKACEVLKKPKKSLAYLLEAYCGVATNKSLQREDWRIRPLSSEMVHYARTDAHYLLYLAHCLASELKTKGLACYGDELYFIHQAWRRSNMSCMQLYEKDFQSSSGDSAATSILLRYSNTQVGSYLKDDKTREVVRQLCIWRDLMARIHDESLQYVLSDEAIIALGVKTPKKLEEVLAVIEDAELKQDKLNFRPQSSPSSVVKCHIKDICCVLQDATGDPNDLFWRMFQRYLTQTKICPLSIYNYALLSEFNIKLVNSLFPKLTGMKAKVTAGRKASRELFVQKFSCKAPVYHNCRIYASDGRLLCYCDQRKIDWYLSRDLAKVVENDPIGIMLVFEPKGRPEDEDNEFYIQHKKNICVGCGEKNHYLRYRIIPSCYRMHFPEHLKSHRSHDIVLLCVDCHEIAHAAAENYKKQIAIEFKTPLYVKKVVHSVEGKVITVSPGHFEGQGESGVSPLQLRTAAMALLRHGFKMPSERRDELIHVVRSYFGGREISTNDIETALLVGMSPHEKRKLGQKRGLPIKPQERDNFCSIHMSTIEEEVECTDRSSNKDITHGSQCKISEVSYHTRILCKENIGNEFIYKSPDTNFSSNVGENHDIKNIGACKASSGRAEFDALKVTKKASVSIDEISVQNFLIEGQNNFSLENADGDLEVYEAKGSSKCNVTSSYSESISTRHAKKLSLLGHGPHGTQVVDHILKEQGEEGILLFCQRWRQVFVDSVHPRFLPAGWDVQHRNFSGRRAFGKFSVYNTSKNSLKAAH